MSDLIDRHEAIDAVMNKCTNIYVGNLPVMVDKKEVYSVLQGLISVTPKRKTGKWIHEIVNDYTEKTYCSECGESAPFVLVSDDYYGVHVHGEDRKTDFCPNCGAKMNGGEQE